MVSDLKDILNLESIGIGDYYEVEGMGDRIIRDDTSESKKRLVEPLTQMKARRREITAWCREHGGMCWQQKQGSRGRSGVDRWAIGRTRGR